MNRTRYESWSAKKLSTTVTTQVTGYSPQVTITKGDSLGYAICRDRKYSDWSSIHYLRGLLGYHRRHGNVEAADRVIKGIEYLKTRNMGGPLLIQKGYSVWDVPWVNLSSSSAYSRTSFVGHLRPDASNGSFNKNSAFLAPSPDDVLFGLGGQAISRCRPLQSEFSAGVMLGELREGLPKAPLTTLLRKGGSAKSLADEFLNLEFGIKPLLADLNAMVASFEAADATWQQVERDAGRHIRRRYRFPDVRTTASSSVPSYGFPAVSTSLYQRRGVLSTETVTTRSTWFSGAFRYSLPKSDWGHFRTQARKWRNLYGLSPDPMTLWNLTPWTWLADWFVSVTPIMDYLGYSLFDGLALQYGYLMEHKTSIKSYVLTGVRLMGSPELQSSRVEVLDTKRRVQALPYGFGLRWEDLSPKQLSILAALGISRADH